MNTTRFRVFVTWLKFSVVLAFLVVIVNTQALTAQATADTFVTRQGSQLLLNGQLFRFAGTNLYWLGLDDNVGGISYPTHFRIDDAFATVQAMGGSVVRGHTLGISVGCALCLEPARNVFNDAAFEPIDYALASAAQHRVRLIVPLTDQWHFYHGGKHVFTAWNGYPDISAAANAANNDTQKTQEAHFYSDPAVIADFETYIDHLLNHRNRYTGVLYRDDPTILAWESGNELWDAPPQWTERIAEYVKSRAPRHLFSDGSAATGLHLNTFQLQQPAVDLYGGHFYPLDIAWMVADAQLARTAAKAYYVGEFDWTDRHAASSNAQLTNFLRNIEDSANGISGDLFWTLLPHADTGGYVQHNDGYTLHYPGDTPDMIVRAQLLRQHAYAQRGTSRTPPTTTPTPAPPTSTPAPAPPSNNAIMVNGSLATNSSPQWGQENVTFSAGAPISALRVNVTVQKRSGQSYQSYAGWTTTLPTGDVQMNVTDYSDTIVYTFSLIAGRTIPAGNTGMVGAQFSGSGGTHLYADDTYSVSITSGGNTTTTTGTFR